MNIYLCGFMGCGKTTIGKALAKALKQDFIDLDEYIKKEEKLSIPEIFSKFGEDYFRQKESECLKNLTDKNLIISTGGGALVSPKNSFIASQNGVVLYLNVSFETCYSRIKNDENRPIVMQKTRFELADLHSTRDSAYRQNSSYIISADCPVDDVVTSILAMLKLHSDI